MSVNTLDLHCSCGGSLRMKTSDAARMESMKKIWFDVHVDSERHSPCTAKEAARARAKQMKQGGRR